MHKRRRTVLSTLTVYHAIGLVLWRSVFGRTNPFSLLSLSSLFSLFSLFPFCFLVLYFSSSSFSVFFFVRFSFLLTFSLFSLTSSRSLLSSQPSMCSPDCCGPLQFNLNDSEWCDPSLPSWTTVPLNGKSDTYFLNTGGMLIQRVLKERR